MDAAYFGLTRDPFGRDPDVDEACLPSARAELFRELLAEDRPDAVSLVVGEPGVGKSVLAAILAARIGRDRDVALVSAVRSDLTWIVGEILEQLPSTPGQRERARASLHALRAPDGSRRVIIVDDAHRLDLDELEGLVRARAGHLVLFGRAPLLDTLGRLAERASIHAHRVAPLGPKEAAEYLAKRVEAAGGNAGTLFSDDARRRLVEGTHGLTALLESIGTQSLRDAAQARYTQVEADVVQAALRRAESPSGSVRDEWAPPVVAPEPVLPEPSEAGESRRALWWLAGSVVGLIAFVAGWFALSGRPEAPSASSSFTAPPPIHEPVARVDPEEEADPADTTTAITPIHEPQSPSAPASEPAGTSSSPSSSEWVVQVGVYQSEGNARAALRELRRLDPGARIESRKGLYFVVTSSLASERAATALERRLKAAGLSTFVRTWNSH
jgi:type II secretory pathway predicted ATPase ExeA